MARLISNLCKLWNDHADWLWMDARDAHEREQAAALPMRLPHEGEGDPVSAPLAEGRAELLEKVRQARGARAATAGLPFTKVEYKDRITFLAYMTLDVDFERLLLTIEKAEGLGAFIDPTLYHRFLQDGDAQEELKSFSAMASALLTVRTEAEKLIERIAAGNGDAAA